MKKLSLAITALAMVLSLSQCKKQEPADDTDGRTVEITLDVRAEGSRSIVNPSTGEVSFV